MMKFRGYRILVLFLLLLHDVSFAQQDSLLLYQKIKQFASKRRFTTFIYNAVFVEPRAADYPVQPTSNEGKIVNPYLEHSGKSIRRIYISVSDPFGRLENDTLIKASTGLERMGNRLHIGTRKWIVHNKLLFKEGGRLDPLSISESERLLRQASFSTDARIFVHAADSGNVDVFVLVHDKWSITAPIELTGQRANITLRDQNFFGLGYELEQYAGFRTPDKYDFSGSYTLTNIDNTYISTGIAYQANNTGTSVGVSANRPFFSPLAQWAGGISLAHAQQFYDYTDAKDGATRTLSVTHVGADVWAGRAIKILRDGKLLKQSHNLVIAGRYLTTQFLKRPYPAGLILRSNNNTSAFIGNIGFALQQYYKGRYIYRFGANEDVPAGFIIQLLYGVQKKEFTLPRFYTGMEVARAGHFDIGYLSATVSGGVFFNKAYTNDITTNFKLYYFSDLFKMDGWYLRQFVNYAIVHGQHKFYNEKLTLSGGDMYGFDGDGLAGNTKMVLDLETVAYAPYNLFGFHLAPVLMMGYGMLGGPGRGLMRSNIYQAYSLGILFRNENLLNSTFQVSFGLYPYFPNGGTYALKYNPVTSFTVRVRPFTIGRPDFVAY